MWGLGLLLVFIIAGTLGIRETKRRYTLGRGWSTAIMIVFILICLGLSVVLLRSLNEDRCDPKHWSDSGLFGYCEDV